MLNAILIAMLISCIFKKLDSDDDDLDIEERRHNVEALPDEELLDPTMPGQTSYKNEQKTLCESFVSHMHFT